MRKSYILIVCFLSVTVGKLQAQCNPPTAFDYLDINNVKARINLTDMWWDLVNQAEYEVPKGGGVSSLFAGALWIGGLDEQGQLHVAAATYRQNGNDFFPGPLDATGNITPDLCNDFDRIWKVNRSTIDSFRWGLLPSTTPSIRYWPGRGNPYLPFLPDQDLAPFFDHNNDGTYDASTGDYPSVLGDQALWYVFNDKGNAHTETGGVPLGIEVQVMAYSYNSISCLKNTTFYEYTIESKESNLDSVYAGLWIDADVGCYFDDYVGCDTSRNMGIGYNGAAVDTNDCTENYGNQPPLIGIRILNVSSNGQVPDKFMTHFVGYQNDFSSQGNPTSDTAYLDYIRSKTINPNGEWVNYAFPGDPSDPAGWSECTENDIIHDRRMVMGSGPYPISKNQKLKITFAAIWVRPPIGTYPCPSFQMLQDTADCVLDQYQSLHPTGLNELPTDAISVYPNPATDRIHFPNVNLNGTTLSIRNVFGEVVMRKTISPVSSYFDISNLDAGIYFIDISSPAKRFVAKFVKD